ncbi:MAG: hypothetical protein COB81_06880 [Flavobacteriaceae bacterium]|nr:MAG: hypothetical protein COB81_06880 [Flavobacteriaceae bacterium]
MGKLKTYIALFRGINVGGKNSLKMASLKEVLKSSLFSEAQTYIQSGNLVFKAVKTDCNALSFQLENLVKDHFNIEVSILVITKKELKEIINKNPFPIKMGHGTTKLYITFIKAAIRPEIIETFAQSTISEDKFHISKKAIYTLYQIKYSASKLNNNFYEKKLNCIATTRNWRTTLKLLEMSKN